MIVDKYFFYRPDCDAMGFNPVKIAKFLRVWEMHGKIWSFGFDVLLSWLRDST